MPDDVQSSEFDANGEAILRAIAQDVDVALLIENLRLTTTERVEKAQRMLDTVVEPQREAQQWRRRRDASE